MRNKILRPLLLVIGTIGVILGVLGMFLPLLPTTPFLLLAAACYARSSGRFYQWLIHNRWFGDYLRDYREGKGIILKHKIVTLLFLWMTIGYTALMVVSFWWLKLLLVCIATGVTLHIATLKTIKEKRVKYSDKRDTLPTLD